MKDYCKLRAPENTKLDTATFRIFSGMSKDLLMKLKTQMVTRGDQDNHKIIASTEKRKK